MTGHPVGKKSASRNPKDAESQRLWRISGLGFELVSMIIAGGLIGYGLDALFNTKPTILIVGVVFGVLSGMTQFIRKAQKLSQHAASDAPHLPRQDLSYLDDQNEDEEDDN